MTRLRFTMTVPLGYRSQTVGDIRAVAFMNGLGCEIETLKSGWLETSYGVTVTGVESAVRMFRASVWRAAHLFREEGA